MSDTLTISEIFRGGPAMASLCLQKHNIADGVYRIVSSVVFE